MTDQKPLYIWNVWQESKNLIECSFDKKKRCSEVIPRFFDDKSALKLTFATLWQTSQSWRKVKYLEIDQKHILELSIS